MEINITIFIQVIIFLMLFLLLSNVFFKPLDHLLKEREKNTLDEKLNINLMQKEIKKQDLYIKERTLFTFKKMQELYEKNKQKNLIQERDTIQGIQLELRTKCNERLLELNNETTLIKKELDINKNSLIKSIFKKLNNN